MKKSYHSIADPADAVSAILMIDGPAAAVVDGASRRAAVRVMAAITSRSDVRRCRARP
jgi:hypothetical protein